MTSCFSPVRLLATLWTIAHQFPLSTGFSRQEYWCGLPCLPPRDLPDPGIELASFKSPALAGGFFTTSVTWKVHYIFRMLHIIPMVTIERISSISLVIQWLRFHTSTARVTGLTLGKGIRIPRAAWHSQNKRI